MPCITYVSKRKFQRQIEAATEKTSCSPIFPVLKKAVIKTVKNFITEIYKDNNYTIVYAERNEHMDSLLNYYNLRSKEYTKKRIRS